MHVKYEILTSDSSKVMAKVKVLRYVGQKSVKVIRLKIVAAFWGMHVSPAKHNYAWLPKTCDYRRDRQTHGQTEAGQWYLYAVMLRRRHKNLVRTERPHHKVKKWKVLVRGIIYTIYECTKATNNILIVSRDSFSHQTWARFQPGGA